MSNYGRNFGFRSFENIIRDGRFRVPKTGTEFMLGTAVTVDPANEGYLVRPAAEAAPDQLSGILLYEHILYTGVDPNLTTPSDFGTAPLNAQVQMIHGIGVKVWLRNTEARELYDGRTIEAVTIVAGLGATPSLAVKDYLTPAADGTWQEGTATNGWLQVEHLDVARGLVECRFTF